MLSDDVERLRRIRYARSRTLWTGSFFTSDDERLSSEISNRECLRLFELDQQFTSFCDAAADVSRAAEAELSRLESLSDAASAGIAKIERSLDVYKKSQNRQKAVSENELQRDQNTYQTAAKLLDERIKQAQIEIDSLKESIGAYEPRPFLKNKQAQELYLQLRALLTAQEKELRSFLRTIANKNDP